MAAFMKPYAGQTYAMLRIVTGFLFIWHGMDKLFGFPSIDHGQELPAFITYGAGPIELIGGVLVMIGLQTRWAAFLCSGLMASAYWMAHGLNLQGGFAVGHPLPIVNEGELAALYCFVFLFIAARGAGMWSLDGDG